MLMISYYLALKNCIETVNFSDFDNIKLYTGRETNTTKCTKHC